MMKRDRTKTSCLNQLIAKCCFGIRTKSFFVLCSLLILTCALCLLLPVKFTPLFIASPHRSFHHVKSYDFLKMMAYPSPSGVRPYGKCHNLSEVIIPDSILKTLSIVNYSKSKFRRVIEEMPTGDRDSFEPFRPILTQAIKRDLLQTYLVLHQALQKANVPFCLITGALLGMYRFTSLQPWDDDLDVWIQVGYWRQVQEALSCLKGYHLMVDENMRWSFFSSTAPRSGTMYQKRYPFIDFFFVAEDDTYVWPLNKVAQTDGVVLKSHVYPLRWDIFDGLKVPVPHNTREVMRTMFGDLSRCKSQSISHMKKALPTTTVQCTSLFPFYGKFTVA